MVNQLSAGVDLFFVLSGVVLGRSFFKSHTQNKQHGLRLFYLSRLVRIGPPYWIALFLVLIFFTPNFIDAQLVFSAQGLERLFVFGTFMQSFDPISFGAFGVISPYWTLSIEIVFYLLLPAIVLLIERIGSALTIFIAYTISFSWLGFVALKAPWLSDLLQSFSTAHGVSQSKEFVLFMLSHQIPQYLPHFAIGTAIGMRLTNRREAYSVGASKTMLLVYVVSLLGVLYFLGTLSLRGGFYNPLVYIDLGNWQKACYFFGESSIYAFIFGGLCLASARIAEIGVWSKGLGYYGKIGYSVYLLHMPLLFAVIRTELFQRIAASGGLRFVWLSLLTLGLITLISHGYYIAVEKPMHSLGTRIRVSGLKHAVDN